MFSFQDKMKRAIILDMDGVVADTKSAYHGAFNTLVQPFGVYVKKEEWFQRFPGTGPHHILSTLFREYGIIENRGNGAAEKDLPKKTEASEEIDSWIERWKKLYQEKVYGGEIQPIPGFLEFNQYLRENDIARIIATGSHEENARMVLRSFGIENQTEIVSNEQVHQRKPNPALFLAAAQRLRVEPEYCTVFEDAVVGVQAAKRAKMMCVALTTTAPREVLEKESPDLIIKDYEQAPLEQLLRSLPTRSNLVFQ